MSRGDDTRGTQTTLRHWLENRRPRELHGPRTPLPKVAVSLFDYHGLSLLPWKARGYRCISIVERGRHTTCSTIAGIETVQLPRMDPCSIREQLPDPGVVAFVIGLPPCRDLCAAGARWWKTKHMRDPEFQTRAINNLNNLLHMLDNFGVPYAILVPASSRTLLHRPHHRVSPHEFGRYLPRDSPHPLFPSEIPSNDAYTKRTFLYGGGGFVLPWKAPVSPVFSQIRLKSGKTKRITPVMASRKSTRARCVAPLGLCNAIVQLHAHPHPHTGCEVRNQSRSSSLSSPSFDDKRDSPLPP
jgi:hypothetical protein